MVAFSLRRPRQLSLAEHSDLRFNVSHSINTMLVAVAHKREVSVETEHVGADIAVERGERRSNFVHAGKALFDLFVSIARPIWFDPFPRFFRTFDDWASTNFANPLL